MGDMGYILQVALIGIVVVMIALTALIYLVKLQGFFAKSLSKYQQQQKELQQTKIEGQTQPETKETENLSLEQENEDKYKEEKESETGDIPLETVAAIVAAISMAIDKPFKVRNIKLIAPQSKKGWVN